MKSLDIFLYEWKHFIRNPFKIVAVLLFVISAVYGLHNGASLYQQQTTEIKKIQEQVNEDKSKYLKMYEESKLVDEQRPWI